MTYRNLTPGKDPDRGQVVRYQCTVCGLRWDVYADMEDEPLAIAQCCPCGGQGRRMRVRQSRRRVRHA
jgi:predicted nucleic acid-binding Zn ribbon protein